MGCFGQVPSTTSRVASLRAFYRMPGSSALLTLLCSPRVPSVGIQCTSPQTGESGESGEPGAPGQGPDCRRPRSRHRPSRPGGSARSRPGGQCRIVNVPSLAIPCHRRRVGRGDGCTLPIRTMCHHPIQSAARRQATLLAAMLRNAPECSGLLRKAPDCSGIGLSMTCRCRPL